ncbi:MAG: PAS domain S-box protein, partial [candidate division Zixibacteria bacterium]|nr:PAS domain S-box protein [candidate division Zixibacteria bacterium]
MPCSFLSEHLSLGLIIYNLKNNTLHANPASEEILGLSSELMQEQLDGFNLYKNGPKNHKNSPPGIVSIVTLLTKDENINSVLKVYNVARKMHIWVDINTVPFHHTSSDDFDNVLIIIKDVTEIVKAEDNLKRSEKRYRDVIDNCGEGIAVLQDGYLIFVNPKGCEISGYSEKELSGQPLVDIIYSEDRERINRITSEVLQNHKSPLPVQFRFINKLDEIRWCECISVFINWDNKPATLNFFRDITRRKLAEIALQESEEKYRTFIENYHGIAFTGDLFFNINSIYGSVKEITGYEPESFITNQPGWSEIILRTDLPAIEEDNNLLISKAKYSTRRTYRIVRRDGKVRWVNEHIKNICDDTDKPQMVEGFIEDITDIKKVEELEYRIKFERLITLISSDFIKIDMADIDFEINKALGVIGQFAEADRSYVFLFKDDLRHLENTHEWCREGVSPQIDNCRDIDSELIPWWMNKLKNKENILIGCINDLPWTADSEKEILQAQDIQSLLAVPMYMGKELIGFLGFDSVNEIRYWSEDTITLLTMAGTIFTNALERKKG